MRVQRVGDPFDMVEKACDRVDRVALILVCLRYREENGAFHDELRQRSRAFPREYARGDE